MQGILKSSAKPISWGLLSASKSRIQVKMMEVMALAIMTIFRN